MSQGSDLNRIFLLAIGCYLMATVAQTATSNAHPQGVMELALRKLASLELHDSGSTPDPVFDPLAYQP